jgi:hypothetical protein
MSESFYFPHCRTFHGPHRRSSLALSCRYFTSRPDLLSRVGGAGTGTAANEPPSAHASGTAMTAAAQRAITANPAAASRLLAAGLNHANNGSGKNNNGHMAAAAQRAITKNPAATSRLLVAGINHANNSNPSGPGNSTTDAGNNDHAPPFNPGRVAAAAHAFSGPPKSSSSPPAAQNTNKLTPQKVSRFHFVKAYIYVLHSLVLSSFVCHVKKKQYFLVATTMMVEIR